MVGSGVREREREVGTFKEPKILLSHYSLEIQNWGEGVGIGGDMSNFQSQDSLPLRILL